MIRYEKVISIITRGFFNRDGKTIKRSQHNLYRGLKYHLLLMFYIIQYYISIKNGKLIYLFLNLNLNFDLYKYIIPILYILYINLYIYCIYHILYHTYIVYIIYYTIPILYNICIYLDLASHSILIPRSVPTRQHRSYDIS